MFMKERLTLEEAYQDYITHAVPPILTLIDAIIHDDDIIITPDLKVILCGVNGRYVHSSRTHFTLGDNPMPSHAKATLDVITDPRVMNLIQSVMSDGVQSMVGGE